MKVIKFGGTSLANTENILRCKKIVESDPERTFVVVSAPGKRFAGDEKITDILINRFGTISNDLDLGLYDYIISRGEHIMGLLMARLLGYQFLDSADYIVISNNGDVDLEKTIRNFKRLDRNGRYVMGGFYGGRGDCSPSSPYGRASMRDHSGSRENCCEPKIPFGAKRSRSVSRRYCVKTFARGGSDYSGAIASTAMRADMYEIYTDTYGVMTADPNKDPNAKTIPTLDYDTMYEMAQNGAQVVFADCCPLLKKYNIPFRVDNTFDPNKSYTTICSTNAFKS